MILGCSFDSAKDNQAFAEKFHFNFPLLCDTDRKVGLAYGATEPGSRDSARRMAVIIGPDGKVQRAWAKVKSATFPAEALALL